MLNLKKEMEKIVEMDSITELEKAVINDILDSVEFDKNDSLEEKNDKIINRMENIVEHGCVSGIVFSMIYCSDIENFFDKHVDDILQLIEDDREELGEFPLSPKYEINRNNLAWYAYEKITYNLLNQLEEY